MINVGTDRTAGFVEQASVAAESQIKMLVVVGRGVVGLDVLPLDQREFLATDRVPVADRSVRAGVHGPPSPGPCAPFAEWVVSANPLERHECLGGFGSSDRQHLGNVEAAVEEPTDGGGIVRHRCERVDALDLRRQEVVGRAAGDTVVPRDTRRLEPSRGLVGLGEEIQTGEARWKAVLV